MKKFNDLYEAVFTAPPTNEKTKNRKEYFNKILLKVFIKSKLVKRPDGMYDYNDNINLTKYDLITLTDLPYKLHTMNGDFHCGWNQLTDLKGIPLFFNSLVCSNNKLTSLTGISIKECDIFSCEFNQLTSLEHCPEKIRVFDCSDNQLINLKHSPKRVKFFYCYNNQLISLQGITDHIQGNLDCSYNQIETLDWFPKRIDGTLNIRNNPILKKIDKSYLKKICEIKGNILM